MKRLLMLACSKGKSPQMSPLPAWQRYDGPAFRVFRKAALDGVDLEDVVFRILSSRYGLIPHDQEIENYDLRMSACRARQLQIGVAAELRGLVQSEQVGSVFIFAGEDYMPALEPLGGWCTLPEASIERGTGGIGYQLQQLKEWLHR